MTHIRVQRILPLLLLVSVAAPVQADLTESVDATTTMTIACPYGCIQFDNGAVFVRAAPDLYRQIVGDGYEYCVESEINVYQVLSNVFAYGPLLLDEAIRGGVSVSVKCVDLGVIIPYGAAAANDLGLNIIVRTASE